jgi:hypothetical protein
MLTDLGVFGLRRWMPRVGLRTVSRQASAMLIEPSRRWRLRAVLPVD